METDKRVRIMQAAEKLFTTRQFHEITLDEVAKQADVGKGTIYQYFADKEDLFFQTAVSGYDELCAVIGACSFEGVSYRRGLVQSVEKISNYFWRRRALFRMIRAEGEKAMGRGGGLLERWGEHRKLLTRAVAAILERGIAAGEIDTVVPPEIMAEFLLGMLRTRILDLAQADPAWQSHDVLIDLFLNGVAPRPATVSAKGRDA